MVIGLLMLDLHFPGARSLKDKRQALRSLETRIRNRFNVSLAEVEHQDLWQRARLGGVGEHRPRPSRVDPGEGGGRGRLGA